MTREAKTKYEENTFNEGNDRHENKIMGSPSYEMFQSTLFCLNAFWLDTEVNWWVRCNDKRRISSRGICRILSAPISQMLTWLEDTTGFFTLHTQVSFLPTQEGGARA